jgi:hypothetical protein
LPLFTFDRTYSDFHLRMEADISVGTDAGLFFRLNKPAPSIFGDYFHGYGVSIKSPDTKQSSGAIIKGLKQPAPTGKEIRLEPGKQFTIEVSARQNHLVVKIDGKVTADVKDPDSKFSAGYFGLRLFNTTTLLRMRKMEVRELPADPQQEAWMPLFNGKDLAGWKPHDRLPNNWKVEDGVLVGRSPHSYLFHAGFADKSFHLRAETRINDGGYGVVVIHTTTHLRSNDSPEGCWACINSTNASAYKSGTLLWTYKNYMAFPGLRKPPPRPNEWFLLDVLSQEGLITVKVDSEFTAQVDIGGRGGGSDHIALNVGNDQSVVAFRKIQYKELPTTRAP